MEARSIKCLVERMLMGLEHESSVIYSQYTPHIRQSKGTTGLLDSTIIK
jgi:hypothetical protein